MPPKLNDLQVYAIEEFVEHYQDGRLSRRELIRHVLPIVGGVGATAALLTQLGCAAAPPVPTPTAVSSPAPPASATPVATPSPLPAATPSPAATATAPSAPTSSPAVSPAARAGAAPAGASAPRSKYSVPADDPAINAADVSFPGEGATLLGYLAQPKTGGPAPGVLVCHEIFGLSEHIRDVTRRLAKAGFVGLAVDLLSRDGGTAKVDPSQMGAKLTADPSQKVADFAAGFRYLQTVSTIKVTTIGMVGFCYGGGITWLVATANPDLKAAVPFYGTNPPLQDVPKIKAAVLAMYGGNDTRVDAGIPAIEDAMTKAGRTFQKMVYPGANHAFHNDTGPSWNEQAAYDAWEKTLAWFRQYLV